MGKYGQTFLTRQRWFTSDPKKVDGWRVWGLTDHFDIVNGERREVYSGSVLGIINGVLIKLGDWRRLTCTVEEDGTISKWEMAPSERFRIGNQENND